eukprot:CAMPEP_0174714368 /NCGR_PEP_ID=MMETSP1094-20130205/17582_1 /TAXON_ID=156173 /ORGANISM="Chrysochromulina brevifilum, Strain UTEX LB 985" /LENGTH=112 /DNA_ID=CAMNT_0015913709 /DNA_START=391 /DNA_END=730 /DNA_ORIENTATION=+
MACVADCDNALDWLDEYGSNDAPLMLLPLVQPAAVEGHTFDGLDFSRSVVLHRATLREGDDPHALPDGREKPPQRRALAASRPPHTSGAGCHTHLPSPTLPMPQPVPRCALI